MRKTVLLSVCLALFCAVAVAQNNSKVDVYGGYIYGRANSTALGLANDANLNGWNASITGYLTKHFGITGDFGGVYGNSGYPSIGARVHGFVFGPTVRFPGKKATVFVHGLFGGIHGSSSPSGISDTAFAMAFGGGLDLNVNHRIAIRVAQADYFYAHLFSTTENNFRYSAGVVFKF